MALASRRDYLECGPAASAATLASQKNPDGTPWVPAVTSTPATPSAPVGQQVTATDVGVAFASQACKRMNVQNRSEDDAGVAQANDVLVVIDGINTIQLMPGMSEAFAVDNANRITVKTFAGTELCVAFIEP